MYSAPNRCPHQGRSFCNVGSGISIDDLVAAVKNGTSYTGAGQFDGAAGTALLRPNGQLESRPSLREILLSSSNNGAPVYLHDIAQAQDSVRMSG